MFSQLKIGYVMSDQILLQLPEAQEAQKQLEALQKESLDSLSAMDKDIQAKYADYQQKESLMTEDAKKRAQQELYDLQNRMQQYRQKKSEELQKKRDILLQPISERIQQTIEKVAKEENFNFIFDKSQQLPVLLYGDLEYNITNKVLDLMIRGSKSTKKKGK